MAIDPSAIIDPSAKIHKNTEICAYVIIGANVEIDSGTIVEVHVVIQGPTKIGKNNHIYSFASIGGDPQDITYVEGQESSLIIGNDNLIREFCTINRGTEKENSITRVGSNNMLMAYVHIAHDCQVGDHIIMSNNASLAGHVRIHDWAILGGFTLVKQFCMIGMHTYVGMGCQINKDIPAYMVASGVQTRVRSINVEGMRRRGFSPNAIAAIKRAFKVVYRESGLLDQSLKELEQSESDHPEVVQFVKCIRSSKVGIMRGPTEE
ncbi:acyl-[acyl-carrier-protein]--UDP-N-acetylglucosamine O-acyltransferase [Candidatus Ruthia magnifica str. Cm (Calyptogena magnifica)]|uniref:Acyl-[acyl-carrier-protein]--UDP-N-acetylglucosamine O-acyltransferase n=1 Tax=Ruthia magnifica subsp. Calyptogena magnifica TaxID=413404 RepID=A1AWK1_RUTMC|nr:acyl-ACP--UDP-N-acetylglucosamine O-acyltransferase [Candidatus Ruthturnera calyptogenae]ABL02308.1 acyl-[acyl-carrier-protein]--UDP-N-acetylglucosamine O-acyltransferase [Candidatus Ruthia magnifica str. Cm (Calyptogena magnifica)]